MIRLHFLFVCLALLVIEFSQQLIPDHSLNSEVKFVRKGVGVGNTTSACQDEVMTIGGSGIPFPKAYIISVNPERYKRTAELLTQCGLHPVHVQPPSPDSCEVILDEHFFHRPDLDKFRRTHSNKLAQIALWKKIANDPDLASIERKMEGQTDELNSYSLIFEDDVVLASSIAPSDVALIVDTAARLSIDAGVFFLGLCEPDCLPHSNQEHMGVEYGQCVGRCAHAYGIHKHRGEFLYEDLAAGINVNSSIEYFYGDVYLHYGLQQMPYNKWPFFAGVRLRMPTAIGGHYGIFLQDRTTFPSEILS
jgi:hypothetical protein